MRLFEAAEGNVMRPITIIFAFALLLALGQPARDQGRTLDEALAAVRAESAKVNLLVTQYADLRTRVDAISAKLDDLYARAIVTHK